MEGQGFNTRIDRDLTRDGQEFTTGRDRDLRQENTGRDRDLRQGGTRIYGKDLRQGGAWIYGRERQLFETGRDRKGQGFKTGI